ncbi:hypothetical protein NDU88_007689, partial [Pleurodeles waltl]
GGKDKQRKEGGGDGAARSGGEQGRIQGKFLKRLGCWRSGEGGGDLPAGMQGQRSLLASRCCRHKRGGRDSPMGDR